MLSDRKTQQTKEFQNTTLAIGEQAATTTPYSLSIFIIHLCNLPVLHLWVWNQSSRRPILRPDCDWDHLLANVDFTRLHRRRQSREF